LRRFFFNRLSVYKHMFLVIFRTGTLLTQPPPLLDFYRIDSTLCLESFMWLWTFLTKWLLRKFFLYIHTWKMLYFIPAPPYLGGNDYDILFCTMIESLFRTRGQWFK
jgi:hypothetical protein